MTDVHTRYTDAELTDIIRDAFFHQGHTLPHIARTLGISYERARWLRDRKTGQAS